MPTSVAHILGGYAALEAGARPSLRVGIFFLLLVVVGSNLPDLDLLPALWAGEVQPRHGGFLHTLLAACFFAAAAGYALARRLGGFHRVAGFTLLAYGSHLVLDLVVPDPSGAGAGLPLLWPLVGAEIRAPIPGLGVLDPFRRVDPHLLQEGFFRSIASLGGVRVVLVDAALVLPLVPLAWGVRRIRERRRLRGRRVLVGRGVGERSRVAVHRGRVELPGAGLLEG